MIDSKSFNTPNQNDICGLNIKQIRPTKYILFRQGFYCYDIKVKAGSNLLHIIYSQAPKTAEGKLWRSDIVWTDGKSN